MVEDDVSIAEMYRLQLELDGFAVAIAQTADAALPLLSTGDPDIILLDVLLPGKSGFDMLEDLKQSGAIAPPVVFLSNFAAPELIEGGLALGAVDYVVKWQTSPKELSRRMRAWIGAGGGRTP